jgi:hypothetical protein
MMLRRRASDDHCLSLDCEPVDRQRGSLAKCTQVLLSSGGSFVRGLSKLILRSAPSTARRTNELYEC